MTLEDTPRPPHHHGNLRAALIDAGIALLREGGTEGLTLRRAAARAGVSHAAPAHHFDGLRGLLTAIAARAFDDFIAAMQTARAKAPPDAFGGLLGICSGYMTYARTNAGLFHLMFVSGDVDRADPDLGRAAMAAYDVLRAACLPYSATGTPDVALETAVWSLVHGFILLGLSDPDHADRPQGRIPDFAALLTGLVAKIQPAPLAGPGKLG